RSERHDAYRTGLLDTELRIQNRIRIRNHMRKRELLTGDIFLNHPLLLRIVHHAPPISKLSTMPTIIASTGTCLPLNRIRAGLPRDTMTFSPMPAPILSAAITC